MTDQLYHVDESRLVLCPDLYNSLRNNFPGGVIVANQGEGCTQSSVRRPDGTLFTSIHYSGEYYRVNCPFCKDTRHRLWVNHMYGQPDANGRAMGFMATCYNEQCLDDYSNRQRFQRVVFGFRNVNERRRSAFVVQQGEWVDPTQLGKVEPPGDVIPLRQLAMAMPDHAACEYLCRQRRYSLHALDHYEIGYCTYSPRYPAATGRIIFPIRMNRELVGWQARYIGTADWRTTPKYYGLPGMRKRLMLYNYDNAKNKPFVVVVEGATDCHVVGDTSVALLGKKLSPYQSTYLLSTWESKPIIMVLDPDAQEESRGAVADLRENGAVVVEVVLPGDHDCGDYDRATLWNIIHAQSRARGVILPVVA